jgi:hypothetical protein
MEPWGNRGIGLRDDWESQLVLVGKPDGNQEDANTENTGGNLHQDGVQGGLNVNTAS